jgi:hypothetical protein
MDRIATGALAPTALLVAALVWTGCTGRSPAPPPPVGRVSVSVNPSGALDPTSIQAVVLTVGPGLIDSTFDPVVAQLSGRAGAGAAAWSVALDGIPAGRARTFHLEALDAGGAVLSSGDATADVLPGATAQIYLLLQPPGGGPVSFANPTIDSLSSSAAVVPIGTAVFLQVAAHARTAGALLGYAWTSTCGELAGAATAAPTWTAPFVAPVDGTCWIDVTVTDPAGGAVTASLQVVVYIVPSVLVADPAGSAVALGTGVTVDIPAGAVTAPTTITVTQLSVPPPPEAGGVASPVYQFGPEGLVFATPITITLPIPPGMSDPVVYWSDASGAGYVPITGIIDPVANTITVQVSHFSSGFVGQGSYCLLHPGLACQAAGGCRTGTCQADGTCQATGNRPDGTACDDGDTCTIRDSCSVGTCRPGLTVCVTGGDAAVSAYPNTWPVIGTIQADETFARDGSGRIVAVEAELVASLLDADGDDLRLTWSSPDCPWPLAGFLPLGATALVATEVVGPASVTVSTVHFRVNDPTRTCTVQLEARDFWPGGLPPVGSGLPPARGGATVGSVVLAAALEATVAPSIIAAGAHTAPVDGTATPGGATYPVAGGEVVWLSVIAVDGSPAFAPSQLPFTFNWTQSGGDLASQPGGLLGEAGDHSPAHSANAWTASTMVGGGSFVEVAVVNRSGLTATYRWTFVAVGP